MESNSTLLIFIFGISLLPKVYSDFYPSLIIKKTYKNYSVADEIQYVEDRNDVLKFSTSPQYQLYNACPEENAPFQPTYSLKVQKSVIDFEARPLQQFFVGDFSEYNCREPNKAIVLKSMIKFTNIGEAQHHIGFLIHEWNANFGELWNEYFLLPMVPEYEFINFLTIKMDWSLGTIKWVRHQIVSRGLLEPEPDAALHPLPPNENNYDVYEFDVNSLYSEENQKKMFFFIFGVSFFRYYNYPERCFIKFQLAPHEDFLLYTWKLPSFMDLNTASMWKQLYPRWRKIETFVRGVARDLEPLIVETGTAKILTLMSQQVYLRERRKSPVPLYIWKLVMFKQSVVDEYTQAILIIMHNDPYTPDQKPICDDVGENLGWRVSNADYKTGLTYVCPVRKYITNKLRIEYKGNYVRLNLNNVQKLESDEKDNYPSLFIIKKPNNNYAVADDFQYVEGENNVLKFSTSPEYQLYNACLEKNAPFYRTFTLKVQESITDFEARPLEQFVKGDFAKYNCSNPIKPVTLKSKERLEHQSLVNYHIGFLIHEKNGNFDKLSEKYENFTEIQEYDFLPFLTIKMDAKTGATLHTSHKIISRGLLEPNSTYLNSFQPNEKNFDIFGFDLDSLYTEENQQNIFSRAFAEKYSSYYSYPNQSLRKVQLVPHEDFQLNTWKLPSLMDLNTAPIWEQLYPQWRIVEAFVRKVARKLGALSIETGVARILTLPNATNMRRAIYLFKRRILAVHKFIWKLITFRQSDDDGNTQAILIIMHNDPYTTDQYPICDDVSENWGWMISNKDYKTGLTYGCPVNEDITTQLHDKFKVNNSSFILSNVQNWEYDKNDIYPSLFIIKKPNNNYAVADEFQHIEGEKGFLKFTTCPEYQLYNACPEKNPSSYETYALKVHESVTDFEASPLEQFVKGDFAKYNCSNPIKPVALKSKRMFKNKFLFEYHVGFLIHDTDANSDKLTEKYENFTEIQYDFLHFLTIRIDTHSRTTLEASHQIVSRGLLEPDSAYSDPFQSNENNVDIYGFDLDSLYTEENQQKVFSLIFGQSYTEYYNPPNQILRKVQLAPHEDFLLHTWKLPSFMDLNTTAMWKQLYSQWRRIEVFVRGVARKLGALTIETGSARILTISNSRNKRKAIYLLKRGKYPVHNYIWKLIKLRSSDNDGKTKAILIVMHNDPYSPDKEPICNDVSENWGWMVSNKDYKTGLTYGCPVNEKITTQLYEEFKVNYSSFNLNNVQEFDENEIFPSLFITKTPNNIYSTADKFQYVESQDNVLKFFTTPGYQLYNACPEENAPFHPTYTLKVQKLVTDFEASPLQQFVEGDFVKYNCRNPIKPIVLKSKHVIEDTFLDEYDIGFLIQEKNGNFGNLSELYENFPETQEHNFLHFLTVTMDVQLGTIVSVLHRIVSRGLLEPQPAYSVPLHSNEKNIDVYGFDVNSLYTEENQAKIFSSIFLEQYSQYYDHPNKSLRKVQLAPLEDFLLNTWKLPSLMDLNTTAMWEQLYLQWRKVEMFVREVARNLEPLIVETGTAKILTLPAAKDKSESVYLREGQKSPVSQYIWKLVKYEQLNGDDYYTQAILIVMHNDPYTPNQEPICDDVSENWGWMVSNIDYKTGLTYGCKVVGNTTKKLNEEYNENYMYENFDLNAVQKLEYDENGLIQWLEENIYLKIMSRS